MLNLAVLLMGAVGLFGLYSGFTGQAKAASTLAVKAGRKEPNDDDLKKAKSQSITAIAMGVIMIGVCAYVELVVLRGV